MFNMYTCIAYLVEIRKFCSKTWFIKVLILRPKCSKTHIQAPLISKNLTPGPLLKGVEEGRGEGEEREGAREGRPPVHIPGYAIAQGRPHIGTNGVSCPLEK